MQDYIDIAQKNGLILLDEGSCQLCGAGTTRGIRECIELFNLGFPFIDYSKTENHLYRFLAVDAHTLQHSEIHGRWNNHFHLTRLHLIFTHNIHWSYHLSPKLSDCLNYYKAHKPNEYLNPPDPLKRGTITVTDVVKAMSDTECQQMITQWSREVYQIWKKYHHLVQDVAKLFCNNFNVNGTQCLQTAVKNS